MRMRSEAWPHETAGDGRPGLSGVLKMGRWGSYPGCPISDFLEASGATRARVRKWIADGWFDVFEGYFWPAKNRAVSFVSNETIDEYNRRRDLGEFASIARSGLIWSDPDANVADPMRAAKIKHAGKTFCIVKSRLRDCVP